MPANLTPDYRAAEAEFRRARDPEERLRGLREMLRTVPKHKGTDHLQADIKTRIKELTEELAGPRKGGARTGPATVVRPEGAGSVVLLGPPNAGKSTLHGRLTGSHAVSGPYPFTTRFPQPGMLPHEDIAFQLIDLPPLATQHPIPWLADALRPADGALVVVDVSDPACVEQLAELHEVLRARRITLSACWPAEPDDDPFAQRLPSLLLLAKADRVDSPEEELAAFAELSGCPYPALAVSAEGGLGLDRIGPFLFGRLHVVRVYTKAPGRPPDLARPFTVRRGQSVEDVAVLIHKELAEGLRYARLWREREQVEGRQVGRDHHVEDGDVLELHVS